MASQLTHLLAGIQALKSALPEKQASILADYGAWFGLGCQGPDIFYHNQRTRPLSIYYGSLLHKRSFGAFIAAFAKNLPNAASNPESAAFLLGFATHAALDRKTHPYIVYRSGWFDPSKPQTKHLKGAHIFLERILDVLVWEKTTGTTIADFQQAKLLVPEENSYTALVQAIASALRETYPQRAGNDDQLEERIKNGFLDTTHIFALTDPSRPPTMTARRFAYFDEGAHSIAMLYPSAIPQTEDWGNSSREPWRFPCEPERNSTASYFDLVDEAVAEMIPVLALLGRILFEPAASRTASDDRLAALSRLAGQESLNVGDAQGLQKAPQWSNPLPIYQLMKQIHEKLIIDLRAQDR